MDACKIPQLCAISRVRYNNIVIPAYIESRYIFIPNIDNDYTYVLGENKKHGAQNLLRQHRRNGLRQRVSSCGVIFTDMHFSARRVVKYTTHGDIGSGFWRSTATKEIRKNEGTNSRTRSNIKI